MTRRPGIEPEEKSLAELFDPIAWERRVAEARERRERALSERKGTDEAAETPRGARIRMVDLAEDAPEANIREERLGAPEPAAPPAAEPAPAPAAVTAPPPGRDGTARLIQALDGVSRRQAKPAVAQRPVASVPPEPALPAAAPPAPPVLPGAERTEAMAATPAPAAPRRSPQMLAMIFAAGALAGGLLAFWLVRASHEPAPQTATPDVEISAADSAAAPAAAPDAFVAEAPELAVNTSPADIAPPRIPTPPADRGFTSASGRAEHPGAIHDPDSQGLTTVPDLADFPAARPPATPAAPETAAVEPEPATDETPTATEAEEAAVTEEQPAAPEDTAATAEPAPEEETAAAVPVGETRVFLHVPRGVPVAESDAIAATLSGAGFGVQPAIRMNLNVSTSNVRYFHAADLENARALAAALGANLPEVPAVRDFTYLQTPARPGTLEVWLSGSGAARSTGAATRQQQPASAPQRAPEPVPAAPAPSATATPQASTPDDSDLPAAVPAGRLRSLVETVQGR